VKLSTSEKTFMFVGFCLRPYRCLDLILVFVFWFASQFFGFVGATFGLNAAEANFSSREKFCSFSHSVRSQSETVSLLKEAIEKYLGRSCDMVAEPLSNPFSSEARKRFEEIGSSNVFLFWLDEKTAEGDFLLRAIYQAPFLQWGMNKQKLPQGFYSETQLRRSDILLAMVAKLFSQLPFQGFVDANGFVSWRQAKKWTTSFEGVEPHGHLPILLEWKPIGWKSAEVSIDDSTKKLKIKYPDREKIRFPLWLSGKD